MYQGFPGFVRYDNIWKGNIPFQFCRKGTIILILINKTEKEIIAEKLPKVHIRKTVHHYFCEEDPRAMALIRKMRGVETKR